MFRKSFCLISSLIFILISALFSVQPVKAASGDAQWARSVVVGPSFSSFSKVITDTDGNIYAVGYIYGSTPFNFGNGVTVNGVFDDPNWGTNAVMVKYNASGDALWAKSTTTATNYSNFNDVTTDSFGNVYAIGYIMENAQYNFGNGATVTGAYAGGENALIVKYNSSGDAQWARSTTVGPNESFFNGVTTDIDGNVYAAGYIFAGNAQYNFGNGATVTGANARADASSNTLIVKYNSSGDAQWARSTTVGPNQSVFYGVTADTLGNIYAVGTLQGNAQYNFGNGATVSAAYNGDRNTLIVKYNTNGDAQWAKSTTTATNRSNLTDATTDNAGNVYVVGFLSNGSAYGFGNSVSVAGPAASGNALLVKYNSSGDAQWAKSTTAAVDYSTFHCVATDANGNIYAAGFINGNGQFSFGNSVTATGAIVDESNAVIVKYNSDGLAQWAKSTTTATDSSSFDGVATDANGNIYAAGNTYGNGQFNFGNSVTVAGTYVWRNALLVKYEGTSTNPTFTTLPGDSRTINIDEDQTITTNPYTIEVKPTAPGGINKVEFYIDDVLIGTDTTADSSGVYSYDWDTATYHSTVKVIAYDLNGYTATLTRSTTVNLASGTSITTLPAAGSGQTLGMKLMICFILLSGVGLYGFKRSQVKYY